MSAPLHELTSIERAALRHLASEDTPETRTERSAWLAEDPRNPIIYQAMRESVELARRKAGRLILKHRGPGETDR